MQTAEMRHRAMWNMGLRFCVSDVNCMLNCKNSLIINRAAWAIGYWMKSQMGDSIRFSWPVKKLTPCWMQWGVPNFKFLTCEWSQGHCQITFVGSELQEFVCIVLVHPSYFMLSVQLSNQMQKDSLNILCRPLFFWYHKMEMKSCLSIFFVYHDPY